MPRSPLPRAPELPASAVWARRAAVPDSSRLPVKAKRPGPVWPAGAYLWARLKRAKRALTSTFATELQKARV
jgi:hypothetical protein